MKVEDVLDRLVLQSMILLLERPAFEIADGLLNLDADGAIRSLVEA